MPIAKRSRLRKACVGLLVASALLVALELVSRWLAPTELRDDPLQTNYMPGWYEKRESDFHLFWRLKKRRRVVSSIGTRGPEVKVPKPDQYRILSLGESSTYAGRLDYEESYSQRLEAGLGRVDDRPVRVVNAGCPGYTLFQGVKWIERVGLELDPDGVLLYFGHNDFLPVAYIQHRGLGLSAEGALTDRELYDRRMRPVGRIGNCLYKHANSYRLLVRLLRPSLSKERQEELVDDSYRQRRVPRKDRRWLLDRAREVCEENGVKLAVVVPWYRDFDEHAALLRRFCKETGVPVVDLPARLSAHAHRIDELFLDEFHPTSEGHALIAAEIEAVLRQTWLH